MSAIIEHFCALCQTPIADQPFNLEDGEEIFCCKGCQIVYQILQAQSALDNFREHPIFKQAFQAGLITNPNLTPSNHSATSSSSEIFHKLHLMIDEMWCPSCGHLIHLILMQEKGIRAAIVDYSTDLAVIEYTPHFISKEKIFRLIKQMGYQPRLLKDPRDETISRSLRLRFILAAFFSLNIMMFAYPIYANDYDGNGEKYALFFAWLSFWSSLPVLTYSAWPIWKRFWIALKMGIWGMESLVFLGVASATGLSIYELYQGNSTVYFDSLTIVILFVLLGKMIESKAKFSAKDSLLKLSLSYPRRGRKRNNEGRDQFVPVKDFEIGDLLVVHMGEKIILDGIVEEGSGHCDESLMTGESLPIPKKKGDFLLAGSLLQQGSLVIRVTAHLEETAFHHIIEMVSKEIEHKSHYVRSADKIVRWFIPLVFCLATFTAFICFYFSINDPSQTPLKTAIIRAVSVLLISCPCAIGIAAPLAEAYLLNLLAKVGIIVRNRGVLSFLGKESVYLFDKTGTVTEGKFTVHKGLEDLSFEEQRILKGLTLQSIHPLALAVQNALLIPALSLERVEEMIGKGLKGYLNGKIYYLGSLDFLKKEGIVVCQDDEKQEKKEIFTFLYYAEQKKCLARLEMGDQLRSGVLSYMKTLLPHRIILLSGDAEEPVKQTAQLCGIKEWVFGAHPLEKRAFVENLKKRGEIVAMFGDGINDAPALTASHVAIAVASATDLSVQVSDLLLTSPSFETLKILRRAALKGKRIINQNLFWAFFYNCIGIFLAMIGYLTPLFAAFAMVTSSLIVLFNARRLSKESV